ncbi:MAG: ANTAR domain-containing protein [Pseudonocardiaceae bacterium]
MDAIYVEQTVRVSDTASEDRWPEFAKRAAQLGVGSMLSFQLYVVGDNLGALNLYNREPDAFDDESEHVGLLFASHAAVAMAGAQRNEQLIRAIGTRDLIGQAKGILMERHKLTAEQAFMLLVRASQATHTKLRDIAEQLTTVGQLPIREDAVPGRE